MYKLLGQIFKFGIVGALAFIVDYTLLIFLTEKVGIYYLVSSTISFSVSVIFNYMCSMKFVFKRKDDISRKKEFVIFIILSVTGLLINQLVMWLGSDVVGITYRITKIGATALVMVWNFVTRKIFLENKSV